MREILFKGKSIRDNKWVYGFYCYIGVNTKLGDMEMANVILHMSNSDCESLVQDVVSVETVGQFTGLTDKNGVKIFEGDLIEGQRKSKSKVVFVNGGFILKHADGSFDYVYESLSEEQNQSYVKQCCVVVGNIHDKEV
jgi:uncharacterized phage protein (TIGR01671 family)